MDYLELLSEKKKLKIEAENTDRINKNMIRNVINDTIDIYGFFYYKGFLYSISYTNEDEYTARGSNLTLSLDGIMTDFIHHSYIIEEVSKTDKVKGLDISLDEIKGIFKQISSYDIYELITGYEDNMDRNERIKLRLEDFTESRSRFQLCEHSVQVFLFNLLKYNGINYERHTINYN